MADSSGEETELASASSGQSELPTPLPKQGDVRPNFSRPITGRTPCHVSGDLELLFPAPGDQEEVFDDCLITELKEILATAPNRSYIRFGRCEVGEEKYLSGGSKPLDIFNSEHWDTDLENDDEDESSIDYSSQHLYTQICKRLNVTPVSHFARHMEEPSISLKYHSLTSTETAAIFKSLRDMLNVERLDLEGNCIQNKGFQLLCDLLIDNKSLKELNIDENGLTDQCITSLADLLSQNSTLKTLSLGSNGFTDRSAYILADCLEDCKLTALSLCHNKLGGTAGVILGPALSTNVYLDILDLSWNQIRGCGAIAIATGLKENVHMKICNLSWNGFGELGGNALADALLVNTNLTTIDISANRLTYPVAVRFAKALGTNEVLEVLKMANNPITTAGCLVLIDAISKSQKSSLGYLDLLENPVEYEFLHVLQEVRAKKVDFQVFHGTILRAGNSTDDIGKPAIDIVRLSQQPVMILKGSLKINNPDKILEWLRKHNVKTKLCSLDNIIKCLKELDRTLSDSAVVNALSALPRHQDDKILISDLLSM
ncbi:LRRC74A [Bugula neritina]|uniref:LRRC74A n=1 Tax=Bugula neritina TaxID=10212 RepID=A0A7J7K4F5_BUGNE|nr:LRRC74A [Bugula neritina]